MFLAYGIYTHVRGFQYADEEEKKRTKQTCLQSNCATPYNG